MSKLISLISARNADLQHGSKQLSMGASYRQLETIGSGIVRQY